MWYITHFVKVPARLPARLRSAFAIGQHLCLQTIAIVYESVLQVWRLKVQFDMIRPTTLIHKDKNLNKQGKVFSYEGPEAAIDRLLRKLQSDSRHTAVEIVERGEIEQRRFSRWHMKRLTASSQLTSLKEIAPELGSLTPSIKQTLEEFLGISAAPRPASH